jgi:uncharacterized membrane protein
MLYAATNAPLTFQRTLMARSTFDQAVVTGLASVTNQVIASFFQETVQAAALVVASRAGRREVDDSDWHRTTLVGDLAAIGLGLALQRSLPQRQREPIPRAAIRSLGYCLSISGAAGAIIGGLQSAVQRASSRPGRSYAIAAPAAAALAAAGIWRVRRAARLDAELPPEETKASGAKALVLGLGVAGGMSAIGIGERRVAHLTARALSRLLPGPDALYRPVGHAAALTGLGIATRTVWVEMLNRIERSQESVEAAFDVAPQIENVSGSHESLVPFNTLSRAGRRYVWTICPPDVIREVMEEEVDTMPIRAYVGLGSADTREDRVDLAIRELERTNAFDRKWLLVASPTGTGYVNYTAVSILELLTRGDCATLAMQYAARPSPLSLDRVAEGRRQTRALMEALNARLGQIPADRRPKLVLFGESLGAWTSQDAFVDRGTQGLVDLGVERAIWIGTPNFSKWKERVLFDDGPHINRSFIGVFNDIGEWNALSAGERRDLSYVMITHHDDGVAVFGPTLAIQAPEWLGPPEKRPVTVPRGMRWVPLTTFFQVLIDMKNSANVVPGVFMAKGHDYRADLLPFFHAVLGLPATPEQLERISVWLERRELVRSLWMKKHGKAGQSLSASVLERLISDERKAGREPNKRILDVLRAIANEEFDAGGRGTP